MYQLVFRLSKQRIYPFSNGFEKMIFWDYPKSSQFSNALWILECTHGLIQSSMLLVHPPSRTIKMASFMHRKGAALDLWCHQITSSFTPSSNSNIRMTQHSRHWLAYRCRVAHWSLLIYLHRYYFSSDINECSSVPCQNGGTCVDQVNSYKCTCSPGYTGSNCQTSKLECSGHSCYFPLAMYSVWLCIPLAMFSWFIRFDIQDIYKYLTRQHHS